MNKMWTRFSLCLILMIMIYSILFITVSTESTETEQSAQKLFSTGFIRLYGIDPNHLLSNRQYNNHGDVFHGAAFYEKRQLRKKSPKNSPRPASPYTIAFPALIRTRRWIEQEH